jgi:protoheme IX farnesyltransferase
MSSISTSAAGELVATPCRHATRRSMLGLYMELTKARLSALVLLTTAVGFMLGGLGPVDWQLMGWTVAGTALAAGCASALNQVIERHRDRRMHRTQRRPLPAGSISAVHGTVAAIVMGCAGAGMLALMVNLAAAALALATILIYIALYTPLKTRSSLNTIVGAVCGAIPPMIGWVAATGSLDIGAWVLGGILFVWQIPHFLALAWLYREDYARGGFVMLPVIDCEGRLTCQVVVLTCALLLPLGLVATLLNVAGPAYAIGSVLLGAWMLILCVRFYARRTNANARAVFLASITYLPLLMCLMVIDRGPA